MIGKDKLFSLLGSEIKKSPAEQTEVVYIGNSHGLTRYANSYIHQNVYDSSSMIYFRAVIGRRMGVSSTTSMEKEDLNRALLTAYNIAMNQRDNPAFEGLPQPEDYPKIRTHFEQTAKFTPKDRAEKAKILFNAAKKHNLTVAGKFATGESEIAVMNSNGVEAYQSATSADVNVIVMGDDSSGYSEAISRKVNDLSFKKLADTAIRKCMDSAKPQEIPPGKYNVILEPKAVAELVEWMNYTGFGAQSMDEGTSFLCGRSGKKIMGDNISIYDDGLDEDGMPFPFDFEGVPKKRVFFVKNGVGGDVLHNSLTASRNKMKSTGHAMPPGNFESTFSLNTFVKGGRNTLNSMISNTERGILVTRFHYVNGMLDTNKALMTGMTRDGTFLIKKGKIAHGIKNMRFTESMLKAFSRAKMISRERQAIDSWWSAVGCLVAPAILISNFNFSGKTEF
ncbi:MAG: TldD/PmbA family protein [candidate division Zixibacteria bacterium]|nr:TldD/PmbA family protein [candidate division Zixibacteria bacterium]